MSAAKAFVLSRPLLSWSALRKHASASSATRIAPSFFHCCTTTVADADTSADDTTGVAALVAALAPLALLENPETICGRGAPATTFSFLPLP